MRDSYETYLYVSPVTWMIERRRDYRAFHPDVDQTKVFAEKQYSDFRWVAGIKTPFKEQQVNWKTGALVNSTIVNSLFYNPTTEPGELTLNLYPSRQMGETELGDGVLHRLLLTKALPM
uniref:Uncharacterized protein n=1 Tax=Phenylobacterium glaciei TaxID=2803784 RepID=A0A974P213_9CAUL|nr:hypothetical protein JKL49_17535 [Phenylobacterium glaciei]